MAKQPTQWIVVPANDETNDSICEFLGQEVEESLFSFSFDRKTKRGFLSPIGYELVTRLKKFATHNQDIQFEVFKKEGDKISPFSFDELRKKKMRRQIRRSVKRGSDL